MEGIKQTSSTRENYPVNNRFELLNGGTPLKPVDYNLVPAHVVMLDILRNRIKHMTITLAQSVLLILKIREVVSELDI
jgi:hypothetical protein